MSSYHKTILVVEDDEADRMFIQMAFRDNGVEAPIHAVDNGDDAIRYLMGEGLYADREHYAFPTFIMTDLNMPQGDGFCVLEHLKANPEWAIIPTVVLTSSNDPDDVHKAYILGASSYHLKPSGYVGLRQLLKRLHEYWMTCEVPEIDATGRRRLTDSRGKLGERIAQPSGGIQARVTQSGGARAESKRTGRKRRHRGKRRRRLPGYGPHL